MVHITISDTIVNTGDKVEPVEILYHMNMGYPLLDEDSIIQIPSAEVIPRDDHAAQDIENWMHMQKTLPNIRNAAIITNLQAKKEKPPFISRN